jgi:hypothetical protein
MKNEKMIKVINIANKKSMYNNVKKCNSKAW